MTSFPNVLLVIVILIFTSCGHQKKEDKWRIRSEKESQLDTLNILESQKLSKRLNSIIDWDTAEKFTYDLQELFENNSRPISFMGFVDDIIKRDSTYILKVENSNFPVNKYFYFIAEISVNFTVFQELKLKLDPTERNEGCFIFQVTKLSSQHPLLKSEIESNGQNVEDASSYVTYDFGETLIKFQGRLVDYFIYNRLKDDE